MPGPVGEQGPRGEKVSEKKGKLKLRKDCFVGKQ